MFFLWRLCVCYMNNLALTYWSLLGARLWKRCVLDRTHCQTNCYEWLYSFTIHTHTHTNTNTHTLTFKPRTSSTQTTSTSSLSRSDIWSLDKIACPLQLIPLQVCALFNVILAKLQISCILPVRYSGEITPPSLITPIQTQCLKSADAGRPLEWTVVYFVIQTGSIVTMVLSNVLV
jgi:hypothetical protein